MRTFGHSRKPLPGLIDYPQPDRDIYWSESTVTTMPAGGSVYGTAEFITPTNLPSEAERGGA
jgi:hypothetical protein